MEDNIDEILNIGTEPSAADKFISKVMDNYSDDEYYSTYNRYVGQNDNSINGNPRIITAPDDYDSIETDDDIVDKKTMENKINAVYDKICLLDRSMAGLGGNINGGIELLSAQITTLARDQADLRNELSEIKKIIEVSKKYI